MARYTKLTVRPGLRVSIDVDGNVGVLDDRDAVICPLGKVYRRYAHDRHWWRQVMLADGSLMQACAEPTRKQAVEELVRRSAYAVAL
jgi:hypothetical protein